MNIIEAIKSEKPFRRQNRTWGMPTSFSIEDILAADWEIKEDSVSITRTQFYKAYAAVLTRANAKLQTPMGESSPGYEDVIFMKSIKDLAKELDLE